MASFLSTRAKMNNTPNLNHNSSIGGVICFQKPIQETAFHAVSYFL